ncbi:MAG: hypothetical protein C0410_02655, partial [Anaerolinea sp.]|nr:hypothetical protein [Anaerolinea sp.]
MIDDGFWQGKPVLVSGGAGFLGSHLVELLVKAGAAVTIMDKLTTGSWENIAHLSSQIRLIEEDIQITNWDKILAEQDYQIFFHLVGTAYVPFSVEYPDLDFRINLACTFQILETLRRSKWTGRLIFPSSAAVYGNPMRIPIYEDDPTVPISPYGASKLAAERYIQIYSKLYDIRAASVRIFSIYGPRQRKLVVYDLICKILDNPDEILLYGDGNQIRDFIYIEDAAQAMMKVAEYGEMKGEVYNLASGKEHSIQELVETACRILQVQPKLVYSGSVRPGEPEKWSVNIDRLRALPYESFWALEDGLKQTIE